MAPVTIWDDKAHADLLIALLPVVKADQGPVGRGLGQCPGERIQLHRWSCRVLTCCFFSTHIRSVLTSVHRQHLQKLQKKEATVAAENGEGNGASAASTPQGQEDRYPSQAQDPFQEGQGRGGR